LDGNFVLKQWYFPNQTLWTEAYATMPPMTSIIITDANGNTTVSNDTIAHAQAITHAKQAVADWIEKTRLAVNVRNINSDILQRMEFDISQKKYFILDTLRKMTEWTILQDTTTLLGYKCQKATTNYYGYKYQAWFTTELPFIGGPRNFRGLPGIILDIWNDEYNIRFEAIELQYPAKEKVPSFETDGKPITKEEFDKIINSTTTH
jgi:GLPGLI family protein